MALNTLANRFIGAASVPLKAAAESYLSPFKAFGGQIGGAVNIALARKRMEDANKQLQDQQARLIEQQKRVTPQGREVLRRDVVGTQQQIDRNIAEARNVVQKEVRPQDEVVKAALGTGAATIGSIFGAGAPAQFAKFAGTSGALGGLFGGIGAALQHKKPLEIVNKAAESAGEFAGRAPAVFGVTRATDPILARTLGQVSLPIQKFLSEHGASAISQPLVRRGIPALLNVAQGAPVNVALGQKPFTPESVGTDLVTGAIFGPGQFSPESPFATSKKETLGQLQEADQKKQGLGLLSDFDQAMRDNDIPKIQAVAKKILQSPDQQYATYKKPVEDMLATLMPAEDAGKGVTVEAYHGEGAGRSPFADVTKDNPTYGPGKYYSTDPKYAGVFGKTQKESVSLQNPLVIKNDDQLDTVMKQVVKDGRQIDEWARAKGYDGIINNVDDTIIKFNPQEGMQELSRNLGKAQEQINPAQPGRSVDFLKLPTDQKTGGLFGKQPQLENPANEAASPAPATPPDVNDVLRAVQAGQVSPEEARWILTEEQQQAAKQIAKTDLTNFESSIANNKKEVVAYFDKSGKKLYETQQGGNYSARIPTDDLNKIKGKASVQSHSHQLVYPQDPNSPLNAIAVMPDKYDMTTALSNGINEVRVVSPLGTVSVKFPQKLNESNVQDVLAQATAVGRKAFYDSKARGESEYFANVFKVNAENNAIINGLGAQVTKSPAIQNVTQGSLANTVGFLASQKAEKVGFLGSLKNAIFGKSQEPTQIPEGTTERKFITSIKESPEMPSLTKSLVSGTYNVRRNSELIDIANTRIAKSEAGAVQFAMNTNSDEATATAIQLTKQLSDKGDYETAVDLVNQKAAQLTEAGRTIQAASLVNSLSPEGIGQLAARTIQKYNIAAKQQIPELTPEQLQAFTTMAEKVQSLPEGSVEQTTAKRELLKAIGGLTPKSWMERLANNVGEAVNIPRAVMATGDLSAPLRQGVFLVGHPKQWIPAFRDMFKYAFSEKAYQNGMEDIKADPNYETMQNSGLSFSDLDSPKLTDHEEAFMSNIIEKIPGFGKVARGSNRAYSGFLNQLRANTFNDLYKQAEEQGVLDARPKAVDSIANFVNTATGRGDLPKSLERSSVILNGVFFSPRLMASRLNLLNPAYYVGLDPFVRRQALKSLFSYAGTALTIATLAKLAGADVSSDPRSSDFGKIKVGDTRYDPWGGFQQYIVAGTRLLSGQMVSSTTGKEINLGEGYKPTTRLDIAQRVFESKESPIASFVTSLLRGQTAIGEKFDLKTEVADRFIPMIWQDMYDLQREWGPKGYLMAIPGIFGAGSQTYGDQIPMKGKTATGRPNIQWRQPPSLGETLINKATNTEVSNIPKDQWGPLQEKRQADTLQKIKEGQAKAEVLTTGKAQRIDNKYIYLDSNGIIRVNDLGPKATTKKKTAAYKAPNMLKTSKVKTASSLKTRF